MNDNVAEYFSFGAVQVVVTTAKKRVVLKFRNSVGANREAQESFVDRLDQLWKDFGGRYAIIMDYTDFEPPSEVDPDEMALFLSLLSALRAVGVTRYHRVMPEHLDSFAAPLVAAVSRAGLDAVTVRSLAEAHARLDQEGS